MLHNSGPYGPNDTPVNMGAPINMSQIPVSGTVSHNLSNLGKIAQQSPQPQTANYNLPDYSSYGHPPLSVPPQMSPFQNFNPVGFHTNYLVQNPTSVHETSWERGVLPINLNAQAGHSHNMFNYPLPFDKRSVNSIDKEDFKDESVCRKNMPINFPQSSKTFQKQDNDQGKYMFDMNEDKFDNFENNLKVNTKYQEKSLLDNTKRRSLENTVRLIENILINTTKNKDLQVNQESTKNNVDDKLNKMTDDVEDIAENETTKNLNLYGTSSKITDQPKSPLEPMMDKTIPNQSNVNQRNPNDEEIITETEHSSSESKEDVKPSIEDIELKMEPNVTIKIEPLCWTETDYMNPFDRDLHAVSRDDVSGDIVDSERSLNEAIAVIKCGLNTVQYYECPHCNLLFRHPKRFLIHTKWHSFGLTNDKRMEMAKEREERRNQRKEARVIDKMNAQEVTDIMPGKGVYPCKECDKAFTSKGSLKNHRQRFHPTKTRECKICRKTMLGWMALRTHMATHINDAAFQCPDCPKKFKHAHSLAKHRDTHLEKTLSCEHCPKKFGSTAQLKIHQKVHERMQRGANFRCTFCGKAFYESYNLTAHERTHKNERPFTCDICNTSFGTNSSLKRHLKVSHSRSKPFECSTCHRSFVTEAIRDRHEIRQHGDPEELKFACDQCECRYLKLKDLQRHVHKAHPKVKRKKKEEKSDSE